MLQHRLRYLFYFITTRLCQLDYNNIVSLENLQECLNESKKNFTKEGAEKIGKVMRIDTMNMHSWIVTVFEDVPLEEYIIFFNTLFIFLKK